MTASITLGIGAAVAAGFLIYKKFIKKEGQFRVALSRKLRVFLAPFMFFAVKKRERKHLLDLLTLV